MTAPGSPNRRSFGRYIRRKRKEAGLSIKAAAKALDYSEYTIKRVETGYDRIALKKLFDYARVYDIRLEELLYRLEHAEPQVANDFRELEAKFRELFMKRLETHLNPHSKPQPLVVE